MTLLAIAVTALALALLIAAFVGMMYVLARASEEHVLDGNEGSEE